MYRVISLAFQHIRADRPDVVLIAAGIVEIPFSKEIMQFRRPDMDALRSALVLVPHLMFFGIRQIRKMRGTA